MGDAPDWYRGDYTPAQDIEKRKEFSIYFKLTRYRGVCLYSNDDYYLLEDQDENFFYYNSGQRCRDKRPVDAKYKRLYDNCPGEWIDYDVHCPMIINTNSFDWEIDRPIKTYYANQNKLPGPIIADLKIRGVKDYYEIKQLIRDRPFFSSHGNAKLGGFPQLLNELYPDKTDFEI